MSEDQKIPDYGIIKDALESGRDRGLRLATDSFGTGYASMGHTLFLHPDLLKLEIDLIRNIDTDPQRLQLCRAIIAFARVLGVWVVADGVASAAELRVVRRLGVSLGATCLLPRWRPA